MTILGHFLSFWDILCRFSPLTTWKIKILILKKTPGDIIILHICTINDNHMMYGSWDKEHNRHNFLSFWTIFCPFTTLWTHGLRKSKLKKNGKNTWRHYHFTNINNIWCMVPQIWSAMDRNFFVILDHFLSFYFPNNLKN